MTVRLRLIGSAVALVFCTSTGAYAQSGIKCVAPTGAPKAVATTGSSQTVRGYRVDVSRSPTAQGAIVVSVHADAGRSDAARTVRVERVILRSAYKSEAIAQPSSFAQGSTPSDVIATFDEAAVRELPAGDVNVVLTTADGERVCRVRKQDRGTLLHHARP